MDEMKLEYRNYFVISSLIIKRAQLRVIGINDSDVSRYSYTRCQIGGNEIIINRQIVLSTEKFCFD